MTTEVKGPQEVRICKHGEHSFSITALWGLLNRTHYSTDDWKGFLTRKGWLKAPRIWY